MKLRHLAIALGVMMAVTGCGSSEPTTTPETEKPAVETPAETEKPEEEVGTGFTGTKTAETAVGGDSTDVIVVEMAFENGQPVDVKIDVRTEAGMKSELAASGEYDMGEGSTPWNEQVDSLAAFIKENNFDLSKVTYTNEEGNTDVVTGVSIKVASYVDAVQALMTEVMSGTTAGDVKVGEAVEEGGKTTATVTFEDGQPVDVKFDYITTEGGSKYEDAKAGTYDMGEGSTPWNEQADAIAAFLKENNFDLSKVVVNEEGKTDAVTGVSIAVPGFITAVENALQQ